MTSRIIEIALLLAFVSVIVNVCMLLIEPSVSLVDHHERVDEAYWRGYADGAAAAKADRRIPNAAVHRAIKAWNAGDKIGINVGRAQFVCRVTGEGLVVITVLRRGE
jgi:hypothetical protein